MCEFQLAFSGNDSYSEQQFQKTDGPGPQQLDMFLVYEIQGQPFSFGTAFPPALIPIPDSSEWDTDNWRVQELIDEGSWSDISKLEIARESLHEDVFEHTASGSEMSEIRIALKQVATRIRELAH